MQSLVLLPADDLQRLVTDAVAHGVRSALDARPPAAPGNDLPEIITRKQAAKLLHVAPSTLDSWAAQNRLPKRKAGSRTLYAKADVLAILSERPRYSHARK